MKHLGPYFVFSSRVPRWLGVEAIVLYPFVFFRQPRDKTAESTMRHELIHVRQIRERGWLGFYTRYLFEYARERWRGRSHDAAYRAIAFEAEAYRDQDKLT